MKHTRPAVAGATAVLAASLIGAVSVASADAQTRITSKQQLQTSIQQAVAQEQAQPMTLSAGTAGPPDGSAELLTRLTPAQVCQRWTPT